MRFSRKSLITFTAIIFILFGSYRFQASDQIFLRADVSTQIHPFSSLMLGTNLGIWTSDHFRSGYLINTLREAGVGAIRFPAGGESDDSMFDRTNHYDWNSAVSPYTRTLRADTIDEFISLCEAVGAEPILTVNARIDDPEMAADIVKYCNIDNDYSVKYFEIGNEPQYYSKHEDDETTAEIYGHRLVKYAKAMKTVDPNILIMGPSPAQPYMSSLWIEPVLELAGRYIDCLTVHWYPLYSKASPRNHPQFPSIENLLFWDYGEQGHQTASMIYPERFINTFPDSMTALKDKYSPEAMLGITEFSPVAGDSVELGISDRFVSAIWYADILGRMAYNGMDIATQFLSLSGNSPNTMLTYDGHVRPFWYTYVMYNRYFGDKMVYSTSSDESKVAFWVSTDSQDPNLHLLLVNKSMDNDISVIVDLDGFKPERAGLAWYLESDFADSKEGFINGVEAASNITLPEIPGEIVDISGNGFKLLLPAKSVTAVIIPPYNEVHESTYSSEAAIEASLSVSSAPSIAKISPSSSEISLVSEISEEFSETEKDEASKEPEKYDTKQTPEIFIAAAIVVAILGILIYMKKRK